MRKDKIIESIRGYILQREPMSDDHKSVNPARIDVAINQAFGDMMFSLGEDGNQYELDNYTKTYYAQAILRSNKVDYVSIPTQVLLMPNGRGIRSVLACGSGADFIPSSLRINSNTKFLPVGSVMNKSTYRLGQVSGVDGNVIVIDHFGDRYKVVEAVDVSIIRPFEAYTMDEDIYMPKGKETMLLQAVLGILGERYTDNVNNNE